MRDHRDVILSLACEEGWRRGVEVGLGSGKLFARLVAAGIDMVGVDLGRRADRRERLLEIADNASAPCLLILQPSTAAAALVQDGWADFVFIDAGHSYGAVTADIAAWRPKVRHGGWLGGHDYHPAHPGVMRAVDEAIGIVETLPYAVWARPC